MKKAGLTKAYCSWWPQTVNNEFCVLFFRNWQHERNNPLQGEKQ